MDGLPLPSLLSQAFVAYVIEFDDEFEHVMPHRTTNHGSTANRGRSAPWLVSMAMWSSCMRFVPAGGFRVRDLGECAWWLTPKGVGTTVKRMGDWWGYLKVEPDPAVSRRDRLIRPTRGGARAQDVWRPLSGVVEQRWRQRFGSHAIDQLLQALADLVARFDDPLPDCLPVYDFDLTRRPPAAARDDAGVSTLLSKMLLAFATELELDSRISMATGSNLLRVLGEVGVRVADLPALTGLAKEGIASSLTILERQGCAAVGADPSGGRARVCRLTTKGRVAQDDYRQRLEEVEARWGERHGPAVSAVRRALEPLVGDPAAGPSPLFGGCAVYSDGWRASLRRPDTLPHYPMMSHRGGFPDGS
jgi:DNA-binding MarR family transcriptional regulator